MSKWLIFLAVFIICLPATAVGKDSSANNILEGDASDCRYTINQGAPHKEWHTQKRRNWCKYVERAKSHLLSQEPSPNAQS